MTPPKTLKLWNIVRLFAAIHIVNGHFFEETLIFNQIPSWLVVMAASSASYSTSLFFVLSGMVLAYARSTQASKIQPIIGQNLKSLLKHTSKVMPYLILGATLDSVFQPFDTLIKTIKHLIFSISLLPPFLLTFPTYNSAAWAVSVFFTGYVIDAFYGFKFAICKSSQIAIIIVNLLILFLFLTYIYWRSLPELPAYPPRFTNYLTQALHIFPPTRILEIILGMCVGVLLGKQYTALHTRVRRYFKRGILGTIAILINIYGLVFLCLQSGELGFLATHGILIFPMTTMLAVLALENDCLPQNKFNHLTNIFGQISAPIYFLHQPIYHTYKYFLNSSCYDSPSTSWGFMFGYYITLVIIATTAHLTLGNLLINNINNTITRVYLKHKKGS